jgi:hypothetical protein
MDKIKKYKRQSIYSLIVFAVLGLILFCIIIWLIKLGNLQLAGVPGVVVLLMFYVNYVNLKTKVEILEELRKEESNKPNKEN